MNKRNPLYTKAKTYLPVDLLPRHLETYARTGELPPGRKPTVSDNSPRLSVSEAMVQAILDNTGILVSGQVIERGLIGRTVSIGLTPVKIIDGLFARGYIILNPASVSGALTLAGTTLASGTRAALASGNTQGSPLGVGNYRNARFFLDISASTGGVVTVNAQSQDPVSENWVETQADIFNSVNAVGTYYADLGTLGVDNALALDWNVSAAGNSTFSIGHILKDGLSGTGSGIANTVYLGNEDVTVNTGLPLLEGTKEKIWARDNTTLYAVSSVVTGTNLSIFELQ